MSERRRSPLPTLVFALVVSASVGYFVLNRLKWTDVLLLRASANWRLLLVGFFAYTGANLLRAMRFRVLTRNQIGTLEFLRTVLIQNLLNTFLPLRAGEASYLLMVHRSGVKLSDGVSSLLGARLLDLLAALLLPVLALPLSHAASRSGAPLLWACVPPLVLLLALALGLTRAEWLASVLSKHSNTARPWLNRALNLAADVLYSFAHLKRSHLLLRIGFLTAVCWALIYVCGYATLAGVGLKLPFFDSVFAYSFPTFASMMPFYMLGGFGVFEGSLSAGLNLVGIPIGIASAASLALHVAELLFIIVPAPLALVPGLWSAGKTTKLAQPRYRA